MDLVLATMVVVFVLAAVFDVTEFLGGSFLKNSQLPAPSQVWTISNVDRQMVGQGKDATEKLCVHFAEAAKPYASNKTNNERLVELYGLDATQWVGKPITVYRTKCDSPNGRVTCIRLSAPNLPPPEPLFDVHGNAVQPPAAPVQQQQPVQPPAAPVQQQPVAAAPQQATAADATQWPPQQDSPPIA